MAHLLRSARIVVRRGARSFTNNTSVRAGARASAFPVVLAVGTAAGALWYTQPQAECSFLSGLFGGSSAPKKAELSPTWVAVRKEIVDIMSKNPYLGGTFVRLAWHSSGTYDKATGTGGSNGATMRFPPECAFGANAGLGVARDALEPVKAAHPDISYGDLWTFAGVTAIEEMGGPAVPWYPGRVDAVDGSKCPPDGRLPDASKDYVHVRDIFYRMGFNDRDIVALIGAHTLGRCYADRSGYVGPWTRDEFGFDNSFFQLLLDEKWTLKKNFSPAQYEDSTGDLMMLPADITLIVDPEFKKYVEIYAKDEDLWKKDFSSAFARLIAFNVPPPAAAK